MAPTADELAAFQQQRAAEPSPSARRLLRILKLLVNVGSEWARDKPYGDWAGN